MRLPSVMPVLAFLIFLPHALQAGGQKQPGKDEDRIVGTWMMASAEKDGKKQAVDDTFRLTFTGDGKFSIKQKGPDSKFGGTYMLNPDKKPKEIDLAVNGKRFLGLYAFEGDYLKLCLGEIGKARPTEFVPPMGTKTILTVLKREK